MLPEYLPKQRWFGGKARRIRATRIADWMALPDSTAVLVLVEIEYEKGEPDTYLLPLGLATGKDADMVRETAPITILSPAISHGEPGFLHDAVSDERTCAAFLSFIEHGRQAPSRNGLIRGAPGTEFEAIRGPAEASLAIRRGSAEQSNTSLFYGDRLMLKLFRRQQPGPNPDCEIGKYLTEKAHFDGIPPFAGAIEYVPADGEPATSGDASGPGGKPGRRLDADSGRTGALLRELRNRRISRRREHGGRRYDGPGGTGTIAVGARPCRHRARVSRQARPSHGRVASGPGFSHWRPGIRSRKCWPRAMYRACWLASARRLLVFWIS